ncbi:hypothetical protein TURU_000073 [Turdus rufiventris]|nr:hypothetical protein TURU_000073 [Turdus rufiventris]
MRAKPVWDTGDTKVGQPQVGTPWGGGDPKVAPVKVGDPRQVFLEVPPQPCHRTLSLQDVELLELFSGDKDTAMPFTFYKTFGGSTHTFEAAAFPGLFLSTAPEQALGLAQGHGATAFYLYRK